MSDSRARTGRRIGVYGWGVVAPGAKDVAAFARALRGGATGLAASRTGELGHGLFTVGDPDFSFDDYAPWVAERFGEGRVGQLRTKMGENTLFAVGAAIQALGTAPGLEALVREVDDACHVYVGSGLGDLPQSYEAARSLDRATRAWNRFWAAPERCRARRRHEAEAVVPEDGPPPRDPAGLPPDSEERLDALLAWEAFWASRSEALHAFEARYAEIEAVTDDGEAGVLNTIKKRQRLHRKLVAEAGCPTPPWTSVSPNLLWNIVNVPASQLTMLLGVHGPAWAPSGACSTFGVVLKCGCDAIRRGEAKVAIVGTTDPRPHPTVVGAFHETRVTPGTGVPNYPFTSLLGTHVSGGACVWILGDEDFMSSRGFEPVGGFVEAVALSSDAEHIITPSASGPKRAIRRALDEAGVGPAEVAVVDLHATGTPGDPTELELVQEFIGDETLVTARKGMLGHGMANAGGWELTALALALEAGEVMPTGIPEGGIHPSVRGKRGRLVTGAAPLPAGCGLKLMLGIGGITACVVLRAGRRRGSA